jgi:hypothetical protein
MERNVIWFYNAVGQRCQKTQLGGNVTCHRAAMAAA